MCSSSDGGARCGSGRARDHREHRLAVGLELLLADAADRAELAKAELKDSATKAGKGAGLLGGAGVAGHMALLFLSIAAWWGLGELIGNGWSAVIVAVVYGIVALVLYSSGRKQLKSVQGAPRTADSVKRIPEALKPEGTR